VKYTKDKFESTKEEWGYKIMKSSKPSIKEDTWREIIISLTCRVERSKGKLVRVREIRFRDLIGAIDRRKIVDHRSGFVGSSQFGKLEVRVLGTREIRVRDLI
jgi:hypothetical protein